MHIVGGTSEYIKPKNIGLLFFTENPERFIPYARIEIVRFHDEIGDKFSEKIFHGPIHKQLKAALDYLNNQVIEEHIFKIPHEAKAQRFFNYPYGALEEALSNAVYHKTYDMQEPIEVRVNTNSINIISFEGPMPPVTNEDLKNETVISRHYRNRRIGDFLKELKFTEGRSTGFPKIYRNLKSNGSPLPKFETDANNAYFLATIYIHKAFQEPDAKSKKIMEFCIEPKTSREILEHEGVSYHSYNMKKIIQPLLDSFCLFPTTEHLNDPSLKYVSREAITQ
jgi:ATP-dependent DNA helicase RecG